ncbi:diphosphate--fructose-6-phosphate 1-phosphotransferase [bacterium]|jgi:diphosphate-dependent phosphofructokinase|nr:diphosphate--fructose-6-phosphate 1-phosphotransferase [bacterium]
MISIEEKTMTAYAKSFEQELNLRPVPTCSVFLSDGSLKPASFQETPIQLSASKSDLFDKSFPKLSIRSKNVVLEAVPSFVESTNKRIAVLFSGGPAPGGHNIVAGIRRICGELNTVFGIKSGPKGLMAKDLFEISLSEVDEILNTGGFDFLGSDRTKIKSDSQYKRVKDCVKEFNLDAIIVIGGDDSNTNVAFMAEFLADEGCSVIGVPKTIDGDLQIDNYLPISFGFDTATKVYSELVGNILKDSASSQKYWHFVKMMGRSASHVALEVALKTHPHIALISEEIAEKEMSLDQIVSQIAESILYRAGKGKNFGVVVIPEGLIEFIPEFRALIDELNSVLGKYKVEIAALPGKSRESFVQTKLRVSSSQLLKTLPEAIKNKLLYERDSHGNLQVSQIPTEELLVSMVAKKISESKSADGFEFEEKQFTLNENELKTMQSFKFASIHHFFGYEGRCGAPSPFDAAFTYNLGLLAGSLALSDKTGYMAAISNLTDGGYLTAIPLISLLSEEMRDGEPRLVIEKALVKMESPAFKSFKDNRISWAKQDGFISPGPIQFWGPLSKTLPELVVLNEDYKTSSFSLK